MNKIVNCFVRCLSLTVLIMLSGYLISYFIHNNPHHLDFTLFILGGVPIVIFLPNVLSKSKSGAIHTPEVIFRKVETIRKKERKETEGILPALSYVLAGILTWLFGWVIY